MAGGFIHARLGLRAEIEDSPETGAYKSRLIHFRNESKDTLEIENLLPLGVSDERPYILSDGPPGLARSTL